MHTDKGIFQHQPLGNYYNICELILIIFMNYATGSGLNVREEKHSFYSYMKAWQIILSIYSNAHPAHPFCVYVFISGVQHHLTVQRIILTHFSPSGSHQSLFSLYRARSDHLLHAGLLPWRYCRTSPHRYNAAGHRPCRKDLDLNRGHTTDKLQHAYGSLS